MKTKIFLLLSFFVISYSCYKEDAVKATPEEERFFNIDSLKNQGTNMYQDRLISYADKYSVLTMYRFDSLLFYYEVASSPSMDYDEAEEQNVGALLDIIDEVFYPLIGDKAIIKFTPLNILIVSDLRKWGEMTSLDCYFGLFSLTFSGANSKINSWDKAQKQKYKNIVTYEYVKRIFDKGLTEFSSDFGKVSIYNNTLVTGDNYKILGFVENSQASFQGEKEDFYAYLRLIISTPTAELTAKGGFLDPEVDKNGFIKKKYDIVVKHFKQHDIDLPKIGNYQVK